MEFTFGVLTYNHKNLILETLESIRYQIETYGKGYEIDLIVTDDASKDNTAEVVRRWVSANSSLFRNFTLIDNAENQGTVYNYNAILDNVKTKYFKIIAGDDVFSSGNLFEKVIQIDDNAIIAYMRMDLLEQQKVLVSERFFSKHLHNMQLNTYEKKLHSVRKGFYFNAPSVIYTKVLYDNAGCRKLNSQFRLYEDDPTWYSMIKNIPDLNVQFMEDIIVLYRVHKKSISTPGIRNSSFGDEVRRLWSMYYNETKGLERLYFWFVSRDNAPKYLSIYNYCQFFRDKLIKFIVSREPGYKQLLAKMKDTAVRENEYYLKIKSSAQEFYEKNIDF